MKKLMLLAAMLALVVVAAAPALAQEPSVKAEDSNVALCQNLITEEAFSDNDIEQNAQLTQTIDAGDDVEEVTQELIQSGVSPELAQECAQSIAVGPPAAAAPKAAAPGAAAPAGGAAGGGGGGGAAKAGGGGGAAAKAGGQLPKTGGGASLLALGAGALLVAGGLVARRMTR